MYGKKKAKYLLHYILYLYQLQKRKKKQSSIYYIHSFNLNIGLD